MPFIPSLSSICIQHIEDDFDCLHVRLNYGPHLSDVVDNIEPRLWLALVKIYDNLPSELHTITLPFTHNHLPQLQRVPSTPQLSLITILDLPACPQLTDSSILQLRHLHLLTAFDASATLLTPYAIKALSDTLLKADAENHRRGPWPLRILRLRNCQHIDNNVHLYLSRFPLLTVVDLRGTNCRPTSDCVFRPSSNLAFFHPSPLSAAIDILPGPDLYSSSNIFKILINDFHQPIATVQKPTNMPQEFYVFVPNRHRELRIKHDDLRQQELTALRQQQLDLSVAGAMDGIARDKFRCCYANIGDNDEQTGKGAGDNPPMVDPLTSVPPPNDTNSQTGHHTNHSASLHHTPESSPEVFYHRKLHPPKNDPAKNYNAEEYYARVNADKMNVSWNHHDAKLALYRTPPVWETLDIYGMNDPKEHRNSRVRMNRGSQEFAMVDRTRMSFQIGQARMDALRHNVTEASTVDGTHAQIPSTCTRSYFERSTNPFRRHSTSSVDLTKPLKPISLLEVPLLPPGHDRHIKNQRSTVTVPSPGISKVSMASSSFINHEPTPKNKFKSSTRVGLQAPHTEDSALSKKYRVKDKHVFDGNHLSYPQPPRASKAGVKAFDWGSWSTK